MVESKPLHTGSISLTVSELQWFPFFLCKKLYRAVTLIIAPTPLVATNFILLGRIIWRLGPQYSRLTPRRCKSYTLIQLVTR